MKKLLISIIVILSVIKVFSQKVLTKYDTIYVSDNKNIYISFDEQPKHAYFDKTLYIGQLNGKTLQLRAVSKNPIITAIQIEFENGNYGGFLKYAKSPKYLFNEHHSQKKQDPVTIKTDTIIKENNEEQASITREEMLQYDIKIIQERTNMVVSKKNKYNDLGAYENNIMAAVTEINNDRTHFYFKIVIHNKTTVDYKVNLLNFSYVEKYKTGIFKKAKENPKELFPEVKSKNLLIKGKEMQALGYAIPLFALGEKSFLRIKINELNGSRNFTIEIPSKILSNCEKIE